MLTSFISHRRPVLQRPRDIETGAVHLDAAVLIQSAAPPGEAARMCFRRFSCGSSWVAPGGEAPGLDLRHAFAGGVGPVGFAAGVAGAELDPDFLSSGETGEVEGGFLAGVREVQRGGNSVAIASWSAARRLCAAPLWTQWETLTYFGLEADFRIFRLPLLGCLRSSTMGSTLTPFARIKALWTDVSCPLILSSSAVPKGVALSPKQATR